MSGGSFQYAFSRVSNFCDELNEILRERTFEVLSEESKDYSFIEESLARKLELAVQIARNTSDIMRAMYENGELQTMISALNGSDK